MSVWPAGALCSPDKDCVRPSLLSFSPVSISYPRAPRRGRGWGHLTAATTASCLIVTHGETWNGIKTFDSGKSVTEYASWLICELWDSWKMMRQKIGIHLENELIVHLQFQCECHNLSSYPNYPLQTHPWHILIVFFNS